MAVYLSGPIAWCNRDDGVYLVEKSDAISFVTETDLPIPLLVEHTNEFEIGCVTNLYVKDNKLIADCVVDDSQFIQLLYEIQEYDERYRLLDTSVFLKILLPSFSSYHTQDSYKIHEISLVDVGRRVGSLWKVNVSQKGPLHRRSSTSYECMKSNLLAILIRQRNSPGRQDCLSRDADVCGLDTGFIYASRLESTMDRGNKALEHVDHLLSQKDLLAPFLEFIKQNVKHGIEEKKAELAFCNALSTSGRKRKQEDSDEDRYEEGAAYMSAPFTKRICKTETKPSKENEGHQTTQYDVLGEKIQTLTNVVDRFVSVMEMSSKSNKQHDNDKAGKEHDIISSGKQCAKEITGADIKSSRLNSGPHADSLNELFA